MTLPPTFLFWFQIAFACPCLLAGASESAIGLDLRGFHRPRRRLSRRHHAHHDPHVLRGRCQRDASQRARWLEQGERAAGLEVATDTDAGPGARAGSDAAEQAAQASLSDDGSNNNDRDHGHHHNGSQTPAAKRADSGVAKEAAVAVAPDGAQVDAHCPNHAHEGRSDGTDGSDAVTRPARAEAASVRGWQCS
eukprot:3894914-Rhodomonas_salina.1